MRPGVFRTCLIMAKIDSKSKKAGSRHSNEPRLVGSIVREVLQGWNSNTALCVDVKTLLRSDLIMKDGKEYKGVMRRDVDVDEFRCDEHFTFVETLPQMQGKRNPHVFCGKYITVTRRDDGTLRPNFKPLPNDGRTFNLERYALGVYNELLWALGGLVEEA